MKSIYIISLLFFFSCSTELPLSPKLEPDFKPIDNNTTALNDEQKSLMNGVYSVIEGKGYFGDEIVGRWIDNRFCLYANHDVVFAINATGFDNDTIKLCGYFRLVRTGTGSILNLKITPDSGSRKLKNCVKPDSLIIGGHTTEGENLLFKRKRYLYNDSVHKPPIILAHRGGGRNAERLGYSENSLDMIKLAQYLGATGIEIDVKRTRDGKIIIFHDETFSPRTVKGSYLLGKVENFDLSQIKQFGELIYGGEIPTLEEALRTVIDSTILSCVWIDIKDPQSVIEAMRIQHEAIHYSTKKGREVLILFGIPTQEIYNAFDSYPNSDSLALLNPVIIEYNINLVTSYHLNYKVWGPRWTNTITDADLYRVQNTNHKMVFTWTIDFYDYVDEFLKRNFDGIVTNYPSLITGIYYSKQP